MSEIRYKDSIYGGSGVTITPRLATGTKIADFNVDGTPGALYAPVTDYSGPGQYSAQFGFNNQATGFASLTTGQHGTASGEYSICGGTQCQATGDGATALGGYSQATATYATAIGSTATASGQTSLSIGYRTTASGTQSVAFGESTTASARNAYAEGQSTQSKQRAAHAEGVSTIADGDAAHAEGHTTSATGDYSHTEGRLTTASGVSAHAEGYGNTSSGSYAHTEGADNVASGTYSHAEGHGTIAQKTAQHVFGTYNIADTTQDGKYIEIVGNGTDITRSNARTLDKQGNLWVAGDVTTGTGASLDACYIDYSAGHGYKTESKRASVPWTTSDAYNVVFSNITPSATDEVWQIDVVAELDQTTYAAASRGEVVLYAQVSASPSSTLSNDLYEKSCLTCRADISKTNQLRIQGIVRKPASSLVFICIKPALTSVPAGSNSAYAQVEMRGVRIG